ncbi:hypothetical protein D1872_292050 [compost metagenome]
MDLLLCSLKLTIIFLQTLFSLCLLVQQLSDLEEGLPPIPSLLFTQYIGWSNGMILLIEPLLNGGRIFHNDQIRLERSNLLWWQLTIN